LAENKGDRPAGLTLQPCDSSLQAQERDWGRSSMASAGSGLASSTRIPTLFVQHAGLGACLYYGLHATRGLKLLRVFIDSCVVAAVGAARIGHNPACPPAPDMLCWGGSRLY
jgi:hypothetical protein